MGSSVQFSSVRCDAIRCDSILQRLGTWMLAAYFIIWHVNIILNYFRQYISLCVLKCVKNTVESCQGDLHTILALHSAALNRTPCSNIGLVEDRIGFGTKRIGTEWRKRHIGATGIWTHAFTSTNKLCLWLLNEIAQYAYIHIFSGLCRFFCHFLIGIAEAASCSHVNSIYGRFAVTCVRGLYL